MRGVIYARYSSDNQREESIEGQLRENTAYAKKNGIEIVGTYIDYKCAGAKRHTCDRKAFRKDWIEDCICGFTKKDTHLPVCVFFCVQESKRLSLLR